MEWEKLLANNTVYKDLISQMGKQLNQKNKLMNQKMGRIDIFPKKRYRWLTDI